MWQTLTAVFAAAFLIPHFLTLSHFIYITCRSGSLRRYRHHESTWALVTGASDGIGFEFARELAGRGFNVILHGRNEAKLIRTVHKLEAQFPNASFKVLLVDVLDRGSWPGLDAFCKKMLQDNLKITVLVNNVGGSTERPAFVTLESCSSERVTKAIDLNATFPTQMTRALLPILRLNQPSLILNIGSIAGRHPFPYISLYSASKAFDEVWSNGLRREMMAEGHDIEVLALIVARVSTPGVGNPPISFFLPSARTLARSALRKVGCGLPCVVAYTPHAFQIGAFELLPRYIRDRIGVKLMRQEAERERKTL